MPTTANNRPPLLTVPLHAPVPPCSHQHSPSQPVRTTYQSHHSLTRPTPHSGSLEDNILHDRYSLYTKSSSYTIYYSFIRSPSHTRSPHTGYPPDTTSPPYIMHFSYPPSFHHNMLPINHSVFLRTAGLLHVPCIFHKPSSFIH